MAKRFKDDRKVSTAPFLFPVRGEKQKEDEEKKKKRKERNVQIQSGTRVERKKQLIGHGILNLELFESSNVIDSPGRRVSNNRPHTNENQILANSGGRRRRRREDGLMSVEGPVTGLMVMIE